MSREVIIASWCDRCDADDRKTAATHTYTIGLVKGETRPALKVVELCDEHDPMLADLHDLIAKHSIPFDPKTAAKPAPVAATSSSHKQAACRICGDVLTTPALLSHIWNVHRKGETRPPVPRICPDCRQPYAPQGMGVHRNNAHGYSSIEDAYEGAS